ncbi:cbb3-type cytochrome oxidase assembly protein CcoS [Blattabacterium cuenoti]|uniref:cbb3-type cytochrome oxidase assembly protein CcoS n=1 Tax=Blattabacterium cuenoti TaxID=1653831 RepID=UPI00163C30D5|nr:cbb3-type cytochrome oxidase assembly protein CcoS [Blattabacterium cuenoti]
MDIIIIMILSSISLSIFFLIFFLISIYSGQFDDFETSKIRILMNDNDDIKNIDLNKDINNMKVNN